MKWNSVKDRLPDKNSKCLVSFECDGKDYLLILSFLVDKQQFIELSPEAFSSRPYMISYPTVTHWIYVKDVPKPESEFTKLMDELEKTKQLIPGFFRLR